ncbi:MAG: CoA ester lyase [Robiginitomaculum sp.]|nr:CoA ester lyase [Robiginitomaculum sp.]
MSKILRSLLFVPADSEKKLAKAGERGADALLLDLEDSVVPSRKSIGRAHCVKFLKQVQTKSEIWVRVNPLGSTYIEDDLAAIIPLSPAGIMLPKPDGPVDIETLGIRIERLEREHGLEIGKIKVLPVATETARAVLSLSLYPRTYLPRLLGLTWGAEDLATDLGALTNKDANGDFAFPYLMVRAQTLLAAKAAGVQAIDTLYDNFRDNDGLRMRATSAFAQGFTGMLAIHPAQVEIINTCFTPTEDQIRSAQAVIKAFDNQPGAGVVSVDGQMKDMPHLKQAQNILALYESTKP